MSVKAKIATGAAALTLVGGGLGMVGSMTASAATPSCGAYGAGSAPTQPIFGFGGSTGSPSTGCEQIFSQKFGPSFLLDVYQTTAKAGQPVILFQRSNTDQAEDFAVENFGSVTGFYHSYHLVSASFAHTYGTDNAYEIQYEPYGVNSNFCVSTYPGQTPQAGYKAQLEWCGAYSNSLWAADTTGATGGSPFDPGTPGDGTAHDNRSTGAAFSPTHTDVALVNGADNSFSNPLVLSYLAGNPTDMPRVQLNVEPEQSQSQPTTTDGAGASNTTVNDGQEWGSVAGLVTR
jgi:hypothetical protein